jgi:hypothetical protein
MGEQEKLWNEARCWYQRPRSPYPTQILELQEQETKDYTDIFRQASGSGFGLLLGDLTSVQDLTRKIRKESGCLQMTGIQHLLSELDVPGKGVRYGAKGSTDDLP